MLQHFHGVIAGLLVVLAAGACVESPYRTSNQQEVKGDGSSVVITHARNEAEARPLADGYCHAQGTAAHFTGMVRYRTRREVLKAASFKCEPDATSQMRDRQSTSPLVKGLDETPRSPPAPTG
ncbi:MAG: hypothetical protein HYX38_12565 [Rhodospirillales bacterium]|nr:hypothetical protein [Rhodospirillales bacterium]